MGGNHPEREGNHRRRFPIQPARQLCAAIHPSGVPPVPDKAWTVGDLQRVLLETLDLARLRAVDAEALDQTGHYLPALYLAFNANNDTVSTDFAPLTGRA
jgi:hypothetical protein